MAGQRILANAIDEDALSRPHDPYFSIPKVDSDLSQEFVDITCKQFANAINRAAQWLQDNLRKEENSQFEVIGYEGVNDLRYPILAVAAAKVQRQIIFPFSMIPPPVKLHLIHSTKCKYYLHIAQATDQIRQLLSDSPHIKPVAIPELSAWLNDKESTPFPYPKSWSGGKDDPWLIFHTSGTTGLPKPITYTNRMMTSFDVAQTLPEPKEKTQLGWHIGQRCYTVAPMSHFSGLCAALQGPTFLRLVNILGPRAKPPTPPLVVEILSSSKADGFVAFPSLLRAMTKNPSTLTVLENLKYINWVGASLDSETGNILTKSVRLCPAMGTTEAGPYFISTVDDKQDWSYYVFQSGQGIEFEEKGENLYELVFKKKQDAVWQQAFQLFPDKSSFETSDLFKKHPTKDGLWAYVGRSDDIVVLSNSANINAASAEEKIMTHPRVRMALVGGAGMDHSYAIIELSPGTSGKTGDPVSNLEDVWPVIEEVNRVLSDYTKIRKEFVIITGSEKGLVTSPKGSIVRLPSLKKFEQEISALFGKV